MSLLFYFKGDSDIFPSNVVDIPNIVNIPLICAPPLVLSLEVYSRKHRSQQPPSDSIEVPTTLCPLASITRFDLLIALLEGIHSTHNPSPYYIASSYHKSSSLFFTYLSFFSFVSIPKFVSDALAHLGWH